HTGRPDGGTVPAVSVAVLLRVRMGDDAGWRHHPVAPLHRLAVAAGASPVSALLLRDVRLAVRAGGSALLALCFFAAVAPLVPLGVGANLALLARIAGGVLWVGAVLAALLALDRLFQADFEDGSLDLIALAPISLESASAAKIAAHWLTTGLPLTLLSP